MRIQQPLQIIFLVLVSALSILSQSSGTNCKDQNRGPNSWAIVFEARTLEDPKELLLDVVLKKDGFTSAQITEFARWAKSKFCNDEIINIAFFDSKSAAKGWHRDLILSEGKNDRRRGTYYFNRSTKEEMIEFSSSKGRPINEIVINLSGKQ